MPLPVTKNPLDMESLNLDNASERTAFYNALTDAGRELTGKRLREMRDRGIIDAEGNRISAATPPDMLDPTSSVEQ